MERKNTMLVTGGSGNLGGAAARYFADNNWKVIALLRTIEGNEKAMRLSNYKGIKALKCSIENKEETMECIRLLADEGVVPSLIFQAAGVFLWDDGYPGNHAFTTPKELEQFLLGANCTTKENINEALIKHFPQAVKGMRNDMVGSHSGLWAADDPRRNGPFKEEGYVHAMQGVEKIGESVQGIFGKVTVHHTPLINTPENRIAFSKERAPDISEEMWRNALTPEQYIRTLFQESFFDQYTKAA